MRCQQEAEGKDEEDSFSEKEPLFKITIHPANKKLRNTSTPVWSGSETEKLFLYLSSFCNNSFPILMEV